MKEIDLLNKIGKWLCKHLGWHKCSDYIEVLDVANNLTKHGICDYCKSECLKDSQGNWFSKDD